MLRELSIFTGSTDLEQALGLLWRTATGAARTPDNATPLAELAARFAADRAAIEALAARLGIDAALPTPAESAQMFRDELLSRQALRAHRGRNVYSAGKAALWHGWWLPFRDALVIDAATLALTAELVALRTEPGGADVTACIALLRDRLLRAGFTVEVVAPPGHAPLLMARRAARGMAGRAVMYGHYDVEAPDRAQWQTDPWTLTERDGRLYGVGVGDNKAALAHRLVCLESTAPSPELLWVIQGEEEVGSPLLHASLAQRLADALGDAPVGLWIEENGYFDRDGTQRMLARVRRGGGDAPPDETLAATVGALEAIGRDYGLAARREARGLNKSFFATGCPFDRALPEGARYLAIGVNDPDSRIHAPDESVPMWTFPVHARQLAAALRSVAEMPPGGRARAHGGEVA
ncbi:MAG: M20/M25/M40 family metallo-hydrolase [bacterium]